ncbi:cupredoxin domain-containing protein [Natronococcus wangiae]|uniref:cupredoxin domain-containing protein n=1 Tax=Natronococcus wangiae TaxID=3068275 RepID=UPI00273E5606|nr:plastocyanin/azurin family copper-binding protein [Natronococcus sp. AD5]
MGIDDSPTRRSVLRTAAAAAAAAGVTGVATAQEDEEDGEADAGEDETGRLPIVLGARTEYWYGIAPEEIEGEENPTLEFEDGEGYELVWINLDGVEHELVLESEAGDEIAVSDETETAGEAVSMTVDAAAEMSEYYCEYHPDSMRGEVELDGGFDLSRGDGGGRTDDDDHMGGDDHVHDGNESDG